MSGIKREALALPHGVALDLECVTQPDRVEISTGTVAWPAGNNYEAGAMIPTVRWSALRSKGSLRETDPCPDMVRIVTISPKVIERFREFRELASSCTVNEMCSQVARPRVTRSIRLFAEYASERFGLRCLDQASQISGGIRVNAPNLRTVTLHPETGKLVGLHVDNWTRLPFDQRHLGPRRICVNLGNDPRYFLYVAPTIRRIVAESQISECGGQSAGAFNRTAAPTAAARAFLSAMPNHPVIRVKVYPGEAYIAPTENLIHDGSSIGIRGLDVSLSLRSCA